MVVWWQIVPSGVLAYRAFWVLLYFDGCGGVFLGRPRRWVVIGGVEGHCVVMCPAVEAEEGVEDVLALSGPAGVGCGCCLQEGICVGVSVLPEEFVFIAPFVVAPHLLLPTLQRCAGGWEFLQVVSVVLLGIHRQGQVAC